jgi:hypothetical protein
VLHLALAISKVLRLKSGSEESREGKSGEKGKEMKLQKGTDGEGLVLWVS